jgi:hypothetical protein
MPQLLLSVLGILALTSDSISQETRGTQKSIERQIRRVIRKRLDAYAQGDAASWGRFVSDDCLCGTATKSNIQREIAERPPHMKTWYDQITNLEVRIYGETAVTRYLIMEHIELAGQAMAVHQRRLETYIRRRRQWILVGGIDTVMPQDPISVAIDPSIYDVYIGQYEYAPGVVDTVTREGDCLLVQVAGQAKEELFPENETTFFARGQDWRLSFVTDDQGCVNAIRFRQHGQDLVGRRIDPSDGGESG